MVRPILLAILVTCSNWCYAQEQELSPLEEVTEFLQGKVWVNNMTCYGDSCINQKYYASYYYWDGTLQDYIKDGINFNALQLSEVIYTEDSITNQKKPTINMSTPMLVVLSKDEQEYPTYNCLYKSESFSGFVELKMNKNLFVLKGLFNDDDTIVTMQYKKTTPPPRIKKMIQFAPAEK
ncbi:MAG: hypothetical protein R2800_15105 [Flavipsychrobacter sp.]